MDWRKMGKHISCNGYIKKMLYTILSCKIVRKYVLIYKTIMLEMIFEHGFLK